MSTAPQSLYTLIRQNLNADGVLPEDFSLPKAADPDALTFADGAMDGILCYHVSPGENDASPLYTVVQLIANGQTEEALDQLYDFFPLGEFKTMLSYIDPLQNWIYEHRDSVPAAPLYHFACQQLTMSSHPEVVKFALSLLELLNTQDEPALQEVITTLALNDEFTLFALFIISSWPDANARIFDLAQKVRGWGRIHAVDRLQPETPEIQDWLLTEGWRNNVLPAYSALTCLEKSQLLERWQQDLTCPTAADELLRAALDGGPVSSLFQSEQGEALITAYLALTVPMTPERTETVRAIADGIKDTAWPTKETLAEQAQALLDQ